MSNRDRKVRSDSKLDALTPEQQEAVFAFCETGGRSLADGAKWLQAEFDIEISTERLSKWLARERQERAFQDRLELISKSTHRSEVITSQVSSVLQLGEAAAATFAAALLDAQIANDDAGIKKAVVPFTMVLEALAKKEKAGADVRNSELSWQKFQFDAAKAALAQAAELQEINRSKGSEREKIERAVERLFGQKPAHVKTAAEVLGNE